MTSRKGQNNLYRNAFLALQLYLFHNERCLCYGMAGLPEGSQYIPKHTGRNEDSNNQDHRLDNECLL